MARLLTTLAIAATLLAPQVDFECRIIGEGPLRGELEQLIATKGLSTRVALLGGQPPNVVLAHLQSADVFALPVTIAPDQTIRDAYNLMAKYRISGIPVTKEGKLVGILTNRDLRFETRMELKVSQVMKREKLITAPEGTSLEKAREILHEHRIEKLPVHRYQPAARPAVQEYDRNAFGISDALVIDVVNVRHLQHARIKGLDLGVECFHKAMIREFNSLRKRPLGPLATIVASLIAARRVKQCITLRAEVGNVNIGVDSEHFAVGARTTI